MRSFICIHFALRVIAGYLSVDEILVDLSFTLVILLYVISSLLFAIIQPYKRTYMNITETLILAILSLVIDKYSSLDDNSSTLATLCMISGSILSTIPLLGLTGVTVYKIFRKLARKSVNCTKLLHSTKTNKEGKEASTHQLLYDIDDSELSDHNLLGEAQNDGELSYGIR